MQGSDTGEAGAGLTHARHKLWAGPLLGFSSKKENRPQFLIGLALEYFMNNDN